MNIPARVSIGRTQPSGEVRIEITCQSSRVRFAELRMTPEAFGNVVTGLSEQPAECDFTNRPELIGSKMETKTAEVMFTAPTGAGPGWAEARKAAARQAVALYEVDGWHGRTEDVLNFHRAVPAKPSVFTVSFHRFVGPDGEPILLDKLPSPVVLCVDDLDGDVFETQSGLARAIAWAFSRGAKRVSCRQFKS
jgi:hypothetical protein